MSINLGDLHDLEVPSKTNFVLGVFLSGLITLATIFICFAFVEMIKSEISEAKNALSQINSKLEGFTNVKNQRDTFLKQKDELRKKNEAISLLESQQTGPFYVLTDLSDIVSKRVYFNEFSIMGNNLKLKGKAIDNITLSNFLIRLEESNYFSNIELRETISQKEDMVDVVSFLVEGNVNFK